MNNIHHSLQSLAINIDKLSFLEGNPRQGDIEAVAKSYKQFGQRKPIVATTDHVVIAGNHQLAAARQLGWDEIAVVITDDDELTAKAFALADNRTAELGSYDDDLLADLLSEVSSVPELMDSTGFTEDDLFDLIGFDDESEEEEEIEVPVEPKTKLGDMYKLGNHYLLCGDATKQDDINKLIQNNKIDMLMIDPPYGIDASNMNLGTTKKDYNKFYRGNDWDKTTIDILPLLTIAKYSCVWGGNYYADLLPVNNDWLCWFKKIKNTSFSEFELAWTNFGKNTRIIEHHWSGEKKLHPTAKPVPVINWALLILSEIKTVLDVFGGSGSTLISCEKLNKQCFMMELDPAYCDVIIERWENLTGEKAQLIEKDQDDS